MPTCRSCPHADTAAVKEINEQLKEGFGEAVKGAYCVCMRDGKSTGLIFTPLAFFPCPPIRDTPIDQKGPLDSFIQKG